MQRQHRRFHLGIFGSQGKTTYATKFLVNAPPCVCCRGPVTVRFIYDAEGQFSEALRIPACRTEFELDQAVPTGYVVFDPHTRFAGDLEDGLTFFARYAFAVSGTVGGRKLFCVDDAGQYVGSQHVISKPMRTLTQTGRRRGIDLVWTAQQPNELHNFIRTQLTEVVCFQMTEDTALEYPKKFGFDVERVRRLGLFEFICRNNRGGQYPVPKNSESF